MSSFPQKGMTIDPAGEFLPVGDIEKLDKIILMSWLLNTLKLVGYRWE